MYESSFVPNQDSFSLDSNGVQRIPHSAPVPHFYDVLVTPEHDATATPTRMWLCEYHYLLACSCLMIRRVLNTWTEAECRFCPSH